MNKLIVHLSLLLIGFAGLSQPVTALGGNGAGNGSATTGSGPGNDQSVALLNPVSMSAAPDSSVLYVSPTGSGTEFSVCKPGNLLAAKARIRTLTGRMNTSLTVALYGGIYVLSEPIQFTEADGGRNGHKVIYKPVGPADVPVLEGGRQITGWQRLNDTIWTAPAADLADCRQFWVNGNRRERAASELTYSVTFWNDPKTTKPVDGVLVPAGAFANYDNLQDVELQFDHYWRNTHLPVIDATFNGNGFNVRLDMDNAAYTYGPLDQTTTYRVVNARALLDQPGEWYFDRPTRTVYYYPIPGEDINRAEAYVGVLDRIVDFRGSSLTNKVTDIRLEGLTMRHNTWLYPNTAVWGYSPLQGETLYYYEPERGREWLMYMPGTVVANRSDRIELINNRIVESGAGGIMLFGQGVDNTLVEGNLIHDISGAGVVISNHFHQSIDEGRIVKDDGFSDVRDNVPAGLEAPCVGNIIRNNYLEGLGMEYKSSVGIHAYYPQHTDISHNELLNMPYSGLSLGWGWEYMVVSPVNHHNRVHHNRIGEYMRGLLDGGAIYTNGYQTANEVDNNYGYNQAARSWRIGDSGAIYPDEGSRNVNFHDNVLQNVNKWLHLWSTSVVNNRFERNYSSTTGEYNVGQSSNVFVDNQVGVNPFPAPAQQIMGASGLLPAYQYLRSAPVNPPVISSYGPGRCVVSIPCAPCLPIQARRL
jgi:hypothetical protein